MTQKIAAHVDVISYSSSNYADYLRDYLLHLFTCICSRISVTLSRGKKDLFFRKYGLQSRFIIYNVVIMTGILIRIF